MNKRFFSPEPRIFAHRGDSVNYPENTLPAFQSAVEMGVDVIETDVHRTKDGRFVVMHDDSVERMTDGAGKVSKLTLAEVKKLDAGYRWSPDGKGFPFRGKGFEIPTLEEMLGAFPGQRFNVDLKDDNPAQVCAFCDLLVSCGAAERVLTASEYSGNLKNARRILPAMATSASRWEIIGIFFLYRSSLIHAKKRIVADALQVPEFYGTSHIVTRGFVRRLHNMGVRVHVWTINREADMKRLLDIGVDAIMSDDPALLKRVMAEHVPARP